MFVSTNQRTLRQACRKIGIEPPAYDSPSYFQELGVVNLRLLIEGVDHRGTGDGFFYASILSFAAEEIEVGT